MFGLVAGRDFGNDGTAEVAEVQAGDPAPDGSGPVELARGMEIGHVFQLGRKYAEALGLQVLDENGKLVTVTMGSYGIGVTRIMAVIAEANNDEKGLIWPQGGRALRRARHRDGQGRGRIRRSPRRSAPTLEAAGQEVLYDDRPKVSPGVKFGDAEMLGVPTIVIVGRGAADGVVELWDRRSGDRSELPVAELVGRPHANAHETAVKARRFGLPTGSNCGLESDVDSLRARHAGARQSFGMRRRAPPRRADGHAISHSRGRSRGGHAQKRLRSADIAPAVSRRQRRCAERTTCASARAFAPLLRRGDAFSHATAALLTARRCRARSSDSSEFM